MCQRLSYLLCRSPILTLLVFVVHEELALKERHCARSVRYRRVRAFWYSDSMVSISRLCGLHVGSDVRDVVVVSMLTEDAIRTSPRSK